LAIQKVCIELGINFGRCEDDLRAMLNKQGITEPTIAQLKKAIDKVEEELHAIIFMYKTDRSRYTKNFEQKEKDVLEGKDMFPKTVADACWVLGGWKDIHGKKDARLNEANDGVTFATTGNEEKNAIRRQKLHATNVQSPDTTQINVTR